MKKLLLLSMSLLSLLGANGQSGLPVNSNYLIERGISPRVLDAAADVLLQEGSFIEHLNLGITRGTDTRNFKIAIIYDPEYKYGKDIRFVIGQTDFNKKELKKLKNAIEKSHQYSRLSRYNLYDESTLELLSENNGEATLTYFYQKSDLEPGLKKIKKFKGSIFIKDNELDKVIITDIKPLGSGLTNFERTVYFEHIDSKGGYIVSAIKETYTQDRGGNTDIYVFEYTTAKYNAPTGEELTWSGAKSVPDLFDNSVNTDTVNASLGGVLPFLGKPATKLGYGLPRPFGINIIKHQQNTNLQFTDLQVGSNGGELVSLKELFDLESSSLEQPVSTYMVRADVWVFPFLNVSGIVGRANAQVKGDIVLDPEIRETIVGLAPFLGLDPENIPTGIPVDINVAVNTIGFGAMLAGGVGDWSFTLNYQFANASVPEANTSTISHVFMPLIGYATPLGVNLLAGAQGQFYDSNIAGFIALEDSNGTLDYSVNFEPRQWNLVLGAYYPIGKHFETNINFGFGDRTSTTVGLGFRF